MKKFVGVLLLSAAASGMVNASPAAGIQGIGMGLGTSYVGAASLSWEPLMEGKSQQTIEQNLPRHMKRQWQDMDLMQFFRDQLKLIWSEEEATAR